jgi:hypothetical protein
MAAPVKTGLCSFFELWGMGNGSTPTAWGPYPLPTIATHWAAWILFVQIFPGVFVQETLTIL